MNMPWDDGLTAREREAEFQRARAERQDHVTPGRSALPVDLEGEITRLRAIEAAARALEEARTRWLAHVTTAPSPYTDTPEETALHEANVAARANLVAALAVARKL